MTKKVICLMAMSLDGFVARKDGSVDWLNEYHETGEDCGVTDFIKSINTIVMGDAAYKQMLTFGPFPYKDKGCFVFTKEPREDDNVTFVEGDVREFLNGLEGERIIWLFGGANLVNQFVKEDLVDEFRLTMVPKILGEGIRLFNDENKEIILKLKEVESFKSGLVNMFYER